MTSSVPYPSIDEALGEKLYPDEEAITSQIADAVEKGIRTQYQAGTARRDVHSKSTGFMRAEFRVHDDIPKSLAKGVFVPGMMMGAAWRSSCSAFPEKRSWRPTGMPRHRISSGSTMTCSSPTIPIPT
jgi:hypothetical protein